MPVCPCWSVVLKTAPIERCVSVGADVAKSSGGERLVGGECARNKDGEERKRAKRATYATSSIVGNIFAKRAAVKHGDCVAKKMRPASVASGSVAADRGVAHIKRGEQRADAPTIERSEVVVNRARHDGNCTSTRGVDAATERRRIALADC